MHVSLLSPLSQEISQSTMTNVMLQRQNGNLQTALQKARRAGADAEVQLATASSSLAARENSLSVYERQWVQLEEQLSLLLASVDGSAPAAGADGLLQLGTAVSPLATDSAALDGQLSSRVARMQQLTKSLVAVAAGAANGNCEALAAKLQSERGPLSAQVKLLSDQCKKQEREVKELRSRLSTANESLDGITKELNRLKFKPQGDDEESEAAKEEAKVEVKTAEAPAAAAAASSGEQNGGNGGGGGVSKEVEAELRGDLEAANKLAESRLSEIQQGMVEIRRLKAAEEEARFKAVTEAQMANHPSFKQLQAQVREYAERCQVAERRSDHLRNEAAQINTLRHSEQNRFEEDKNERSRKANEEAKAHSRALSQAMSEKQSIELQLLQAVQQQTKDKDASRELEERLKMKSSDAKRAATEIQRLKDAVKAKDNEVSRARAAEEKANERAKGLELELEGLKKAGGSSDPAEAEKKWQEALVKLGTAEQRAAAAASDLETGQQIQDALTEEVEGMSTAVSKQPTAAALISPPPALSTSLMLSLTQRTPCLPALHTRSMRRCRVRMTSLGRRLH